MKIITANSFLKVCSGIAMVMLAASALFFSVKKAEASPYANFKPMPVGNGKYMFQYEVSQAQNGTFYWQILVWNTETGAFKVYNWNKDGNWEDNFEKGLPSLP